ncbi:MAG: TIGR02266 family protein [Deltaproteobacteria bacterium]|nr:TIGR02266 family protein [Deltaproteobacteria bacterium]
MSQSNRRKATRLGVEVKVDYRTVGSFITDYTKDISQGGIFVATSLPLDVGEKVRLRITMPGRDLPFALEGVVRWNALVQDKEKQTPGMGIEFTNFGDEVKDELARLVAKLTEQPG